MTRATEDVLGYQVLALNRHRCVDEIADWIQNDAVSDAKGKAKWLACLNPHSYVVAMKDKGFSSALSAANWLVPDGVGVILASKALRGKIRERVTGSDIFYGVMERLNQRRGGRVFFMGSTEATLAVIKHRFASDYPGVDLVGTYSPPYKAKFTDEDCDAMLRAINDARPDVLWVGMTAPKQEIWIKENIGRFQTVRFVAAVGAVFDFYAGNVERSHPIYQKIGIEWLPRLLQEPRRLWRRTFVSAPIFVWNIFKARVGFRSSGNRL